MSFSYVSRPVTVQAVSFSDMNQTKHTNHVPGWFMDTLMKHTIFKKAPDSTEWFCSTKQGVVPVNPTDMIVCLHDGEIYPCALKTFHEKYEALPEAKQG